MEDKWMIKGLEFGNCPCSHGCPCQFNAPSTKGFCEAVVGFKIEEGYFNDTSLDGVKFSVLMKWPGEIADGNGKCQLIIDESTNEDQRAAISKIATGQSTAPGATIFWVFATTMSEVLDTLFAPIELEIDMKARRAHHHVDGLIESTGEPLKNPFSGEDDRRGIYNPNGFEYMYAELGNGRSRVTAGLQMGFENTYAQFNVLHMNQDGVIRDQKIPF
ncbi:MAG: DUF1326 domain-containing protein [Verrucomicrobia bacterium]|nr:DUF1326 domain-containing protein [Verrucomicrobiota bacterium]MDA1066482.1 DUF1326 domain-containing protein [Verrucomicrobiota bacterium]